MAARGCLCPRRPAAPLSSEGVPGFPQDLQERMDTMPIGGGRGRPASADPRARLDLEAEMEQPSPHGTRELLPTQSFVRGQVRRGP